MAQAYRYPLTRVCLRGGTMTLPLAMLELFPETGDITAVDLSTGKEYALELTSRRQLAGLGPLYGDHGLEVNDELHVTPLGGGRFGFETVSKARRASQERTTALTAVLDELAAAGVAVTEGEMHALYPTLPAGFDVTPYLAADPRFELRNGRWQSVAAAAASAEASAPQGAEAGEQAKPARITAAVVDEAAELVEVAADADGAQASAPLRVVSGAQRVADVGFGSGAMGAAAAAGAASASGPAQPPLWDGAGAWQAGAQERPVPAPRQVHERRVPEGGAEPGPRPGEQSDSDLVALALSQRLRSVLEPLGFRLTPLGGGQVTLLADMGRRSYQVHTQLLPTGERLDWASLLAKRRASSARYLAVIGDHRDLLRLTSPAELARATLWSWEALDRLRVLHGTVPLTPIDLESHFERDGLFEAGLQRFEGGVTERVAERGSMSEVLTRLAHLRAPGVFLLEELAADASMSRETVLRILERLSEAPFHLVARVDQGEFLLRMRVVDALGNLSAYATSLRDRLPNRKRERVIGLDDEVVEEDVVQDDLGDPGTSGGPGLKA